MILGCTICESLNVTKKIELQDDVTGTLFHAGQCADCHGVYLVDRPDAQKLKDYYDTDRGHEMHQQGMSIFAAMKKYLLKLDIAPLKKFVSKNSYVTDVGAGDGAFFKELSNYFSSVKAVDSVSKPAWLQEKAQYSAADINSEEELLSAIKHQDKVPDVICMRHVFEHLLEPKKVLHALNQAGVEWVLIIVPNYDSFWRKAFGKYWAYWDPPRHITHFTAQSLCKIANLSGYKVAYTKFYGIDGFVTSINRRLRLTGSNGSITHFTRAKGVLSAISSALSYPFGKNVIYSILQISHKI